MAQDTNSDTNNGAGWYCDWVDPETGEECGDWWPNKYRYGRHRKSHETRPCGVCGREIGRNGHTQHQRVCRGGPEPDTTPEPVGVPWPALQAVVDDHVGLTIEVADGSVLVATPTRAAFMTRTAAAAYVAALVADGATAMLIPSCQIVPPSQAKRWRRITPLDTPPPPVAVSKPKPVTPVLPAARGLLTCL